MDIMAENLSNSETQAYKRRLFNIEDLNDLEQNVPGAI